MGTVARLHPDHESPVAANLAAERAVLGACIVDPTALDRVKDFLLPDHFHSGAHQRIATAAWALAESGTAVDVVTVGAWLKERGQLDQVDGMGFLTEVMLATPAVSNVRAHAKIVFDEWRKRDTATLLRGALAKLDTGAVAESPQDFLEKLLAGVTARTQNTPDRTFKTNTELCGEYLRHLGKMTKGFAAGERAGSIPIGLSGFDEHTGGLILGQKTTVAALSGVGKTHFAVHAMIAAARKGIGSILYSTELSEDEFAARELSNLLGVNAKKLELTRAGVPQLNQADWSQMMTHGRAFEGFPILVDDRSSITADQICSDVRRWTERFYAVFGKPLGLVVVDYIQRLSPPDHLRKSERRVQIDYGTVQLTKLAKECKVALVELAQQQTPERGKENSRPGMYEIADCKTSTKEAHSVVFFYRPEKTNKRRVNMYLAKMRGGEECEWELDLDGSQSRFSEVRQ